MSLGSRLEQLMPALSARQRISLALRAATAGEQPDRKLSQLDTIEERREYDRYVALILAANEELGSSLFGLKVIAASLTNRFADVDLLKRAAALAAEQEGTAPPIHPVRNWRRYKQISTGDFLAGVAEDIRSEMQRELELRLAEMRALEIIWSDIAAQFDGEDPRHPDLTREAGAVRVSLEDLFGRVCLRPKKLPEPTAEMLDGFRARVERSFSYLELREPRP